MRKKRILQLVCLILLLVIGRAAVLFLIEPVDYSIYFNRILKNKTAKHEDRINMVFVGASRTLRTFDPVVFEEELGLDCVFNAASGLQPVEAGYYMLKEIADRYHPKYAVVGVSWDELLPYNSTLAKVIVLDRLTGSNKLSYLRNAFTPDEYLNAVSLCYRFRNNFTADTIRETVSEKLELEKNGYSQRYSDPDLYADNGFIYSYQTGDIPNYLPISYDPQKVLPEKAAYLEKIAELCEQNGIRLFLVSAPTTVMTLYRVENYQQAVDYYADFAAAHGISYVNLNYLRGREEWLGDELMFDFNHVNGEGAELVSRQYARILKSLIAGEEPPDVLYRNLQEFQADVHRIIAVGADISIYDLQASVRITSRQTEGITAEYRISVSPNGEEYVPMTDWTSETDFKFDVSAYRGTLYFRIEARSTTGEPGCVITVQKEV